MSYKQIKWLILTIPTISVGLWEYIRHEYLLPYISMELGNWLTPVIVLVITLTLLVHLFVIYEKMQEDLKKERAENAVLQDRERIARELHDGMAQTLFLCSVELDNLQEKYNDPSLNRINQHLRQLHDDVRQAITNLKTSDGNSLFFLRDKILHLMERFQIDTGIDVTTNLQLKGDQLNSKEKVELFACLQESFTNIRKHARADKVTVNLLPAGEGWKCMIEDNGIGFDGNIFSHPDRYGLRIMQERAESIGARLQIRRQSGKTIVSIEKGGDFHE